MRTGAAQRSERSDAGSAFGGMIDFAVLGGAVLEAISERLQKVFKTLRGEGHLTEKHVDDALAEIRRALLGADVALPVVKEFTAQGAGARPREGSPRLAVARRSRS